MLGLKSCVRLSCFYIPPSTTDSLSTFITACDCLVEYHTTKHPHFICGDFNVPKINWSLPVSLGGPLSNFIISLCRRLNLMQIIQEHTCNTGHIRDLLLCDVFSFSKLISREICPPRAHTRDHSGLIFDVSINLVTSTASEKEAL